MLKKVSLLLPVLAVLLFMEIKGNPVIEADASVDPKDPESSRILPKADWLNFHNTWALPSLPSVASFFQNEDKTEKEAGLMKTRIEALEQSQKDIIKMLKKITEDMKSISSPYVNKKPDIVLPEKRKEEPILPAKSTNNGKDKPIILMKSVINENSSASQESVEPESPIDDNKDDMDSVITEILEETSSKPENGTAASEENGQKLGNEIQMPATEINDHLPSTDDVNSS